MGEDEVLEQAEERLVSKNVTVFVEDAVDFEDVVKFEAGGGEEENDVSLDELFDPTKIVSLPDERGGKRRGHGESEEDFDFEEDNGQKSVVEDPTEVTLNKSVIDPRHCKAGHIMLVNESFKPVPSGRIALGPLPFLGLFTEFGTRKRARTPPVVQADRWHLVKVPLRGELPPRCPIDKYAHPITPDHEPSWEYVRPLIPVDPTKGRRILHHFPTTGDKKHMFKLLMPSGYFRRRSGGGWICRRWIKRRWPRKLINHTEEEWEATQKRKEQIEKVREEKFQKAFRDVWDGINGMDQGIMKETFMLMVKEKEKRAERKQDLYDQWDLKVFNYIQRQTQDKINDESYDPHVVTAKQMDLQRKFCKAWQKRRLFLDIIHPEEYNPYEYQDTAMKYSDTNLYDPVKHDWLKERREKIFMCEDAPAKHRSRDTLKLESWPEPFFKSVMAGRVCCDDELGERVHLAAVPEKWASHPVLYNKRWFSEFWHTSFPKGGKCCDCPRPLDQRDAPAPPWRGIGIVWDAPPKLQQKLQISEENPWF